MDSAKRKKPLGKTIAYGVASLALYAGVFSFATPITEAFARGSLWAAGPILTVFVFSYVHGSFAHNLWCCLGIEAKQTRVAARTERPATRPQPRATLNA